MDIHIIVAATHQASVAVRLVVHGAGGRVVAEAAGLGVGVYGVERGGLCDVAVVECRLVGGRQGRWGL